MFTAALRLPILLLAGAALLSGCAVATAGVTKGDERNFVRSLNDVNSERVIKARLKRAYGYEVKGVDVETREGVVLLSGNVPRKEDRIEAARIAWSAPKVEQVGNEILIRDKQGFVRGTKDSFLEKSVSARLMADKYVKGRNFNVETHDGIVYLLGVARTQQELERAARIASLTKGTREVISYARVADLPMTQEPSLQAEALPTQRALPDWVTDAPLPQQDSTPNAAPMRSAPMSEPIPFRAPQAAQPVELGELPPAPAALQSQPDATPFYIDPDTGEQIPVFYGR